VLVLILSAAAFAAEPPLAISGPDSAPVYKMVDLATPDSYGAAVWEFDPEPADTRLSSSGKVVTFTGPPGVYKVRATIASSTRPRRQSTSRS
jgi:hypothetical protein